MSQALTSTLHFDVHACFTVFSDSRAEETTPSTSPLRRASSREPTKKIKTKGAALLDFKKNEKPTYETRPRMTKREGGRENRKMSMTNRWQVTRRWQIGDSRQSDDKIRRVRRDVDSMKRTQRRRRPRNKRKHRRLVTDVNKAMSKAVEIKTLMDGNNSMMQKGRMVMTWQVKIFPNRIMR